MKKRFVFTLEQLKASKAASLNAHLFSEEKASKKKSKYNNNKTEVDGIVFDSEREANRYKELRGLLKIGVIGMLRLQVSYELNEGGSHSVKYIADFEYIISNTGEKVTEDSKGFKTREYLRKKRLMKKIYGITIKET